MDFIPSVSSLALTYVHSTDELQKASAYMTEAYLLSRERPPRTPFEYAFGLGLGFFEWLEGDTAAPANKTKQTTSKATRNQYGSVTYRFSGYQIIKWFLVIRSRDEHSVELGPGTIGPAALGEPLELTGLEGNPQTKIAQVNPNRYRLERFGKAMSGTGSWEAPGAVLNGLYSVIYVYA